MSGDTFRAGFTVTRGPGGFGDVDHAPMDKYAVCAISSPPMSTIDVSPLLESYESVTEFPTHSSSRFLNRGQSIVSDSYSPPSPIGLMPYLTVCGSHNRPALCTHQVQQRLSDLGQSHSQMLLPQTCFVRGALIWDQSPPIAAVLMITASIPSSSIAFNNCTWSFRQSGASGVRCRRLHLSNSQAAAKSSKEPTRSPHEHAGSQTESLPHRPPRYPGTSPNLRYSRQGGGNLTKHSFTNS